MSTLERVKVTLPMGFDPRRHGAALLAIVVDKHGEGFEIESVDLASSTAYATRGAAITEVTRQEKSDSFDVRLARDTKPSDGAKAAARFEDRHPGYYMTAFEPFLGKATLSRLSDDEARCRGAVATALGVKPWDVNVKQALDGGFDLVLPKTYLGSKHDTKLTEVAETIVGAPGWYITTNPQVTPPTARLIPSTPPTFPEVYPTPMKRLGRGDIDRVPFGRVLPRNGEDHGPEVAIDWTDSAWVLLAGTPGSGKSVALNAILADALSNGSELVVVDDQSKAVDFEAFKPFVRDHGWGCDSLEHAAAALGLVREEGKRRAAVLKDMGLNNWLDMPKSKRFKPILIVFDEVSAVLVPDPPLKGIPKDHPIFLENQRINVAKALIGSFSTKIIAELRFVGIRMIMSTQATNANTGVGPSTRTKMGHFILQGVNPSKAARNQIFADETSVPTVPENVKSGGKRARGVGVCDLGGQAPVVYKTYFASPNDYASALRSLGVPTTSRPSPTAAQIDQFLPSLDEGDEAGHGGGRRDGRGNEGPGGHDISPVSGRTLAEIGAEMGDPNAGWDTDPESGKRLTGFQRSNAARSAVVRGAKQVPARKPAPDQTDGA